MRHEVDRQVENDRICNLVRDVGSHRSKSFCGWVVEGIPRMLFDDRTLCIQGEDFQSRTKGVHENGEEKKGSARVERVGVGLEVVEDRTDDERHDGVCEELSERNAWVTP